MPKLDKDTSLEELIKELKSIKNKFGEVTSEKQPSMVQLDPDNVANRISSSVGKFLSEGTQKAGEKIGESLKGQKELLQNFWGVDLGKIKIGLPKSSGTALATAAEESSPNITPEDMAQTPFSMTPGEGSNFNPLLGRQAPSQLPTATPNEGYVAPTQIPPSNDLAAAGDRLRSATAPGAFAGMKEGVFGMPQSNVGQFQGQQGRTTAYYAGKFLGDVVRSRLDLSTAGQESKLAAETPGTPQYQSIVAAQTKQKAGEREADIAKQRATHPMQLTPEQVAVLDADFAKYASPEGLEHIKEKTGAATDTEAKQQLATILIRKHGVGSAIYIRRALGLSSGASEEEKLQMLMQNLEEMEAAP